MVDSKMFRAKVLKIFLKLYLPTHWGCLKDSPWGILYTYGREIVGGKLALSLSTSLNLNTFNDHLFIFTDAFVLQKPTIAVTLSRWLKINTKSNKEVNKKLLMLLWEGHKRSTPKLIPRKISINVQWMSKLWVCEDIVINCCYKVKTQG